MYLVGFLVFMAFLVLTISMTSFVGAYIDIPSLIIVLAFSIPMHIASGLFGDFIKGFNLMGQKENKYTLIELKKILESVRLMVKLLLVSGILGSIIGMVGILSNLNDISTLGPNLAVALLSVFHAVLFIFILLPIQSKVKAIIHTLE